MNGIVSADQLHQWCLDAGIYGPDDKVRRVVIDMEAHHFVQVYVEKVGDDRILSVEAPKIIVSESAGEDRPPPRDTSESEKFVRRKKRKWARRD